MGKQNEKHSYHLEQGENNGWNSYYGGVKDDSTIAVQDYEFLKEHCDLSEDDISLFLDKTLSVDSMVSNLKEMKREQCLLWYTDFINRVGHLPKLNDFYNGLDIISTY